MLIAASPTKATNFELSAELTYPIKVGNSTGFMVLISCLTSAIFGWEIGYMIGDYKKLDQETLTRNL